MSLAVVPALQFICFICTLQWRLVRASLQKEIRQEEVLNCFLCVVGRRTGVGGGLLVSIFAGYVPLASSQNHCAIIVHFRSILSPFIDPILVIFGHYSLFLAYFLAYNEPHLSYFWENGFLTLNVTKEVRHHFRNFLESAWKGDPFIGSRVDVDGHNIIRMRKLGISYESPVYMFWQCGIQRPLIRFQLCACRDLPVTLAEHEWSFNTLLKVYMTDFFIC